MPGRSTRLRVGASSAARQPSARYHLVPLELGGAPYDPRNLWPEPRFSPDGWNAGRKDDLEYALNRLVCNGTLPLAAAQQAIATDWVAAYRQYVGPGE